MSHPPSAPRRGYTLIELLVAVSIGLAVCATAFAVIRIASQSLTAVERLSIENGLMRAAIHAGFDEIDTWNALDPRDASGPLRAAAQPFSAFDWTAEGLGHAMAQHHQATLWRGCGATHDQRRYGNYQVVANRADSDPDKRWYGQMLQRVGDSLGYYALTDYAPGNTIYSYMDSYGTVPDEFKDSGYGADHFYAPTTDIGPRDIHRLTEAGGFCISRLFPGVSQNHFSFWDNWGSGFGALITTDPANPQWDYAGLHARSAQPLSLLPLRPTHWPEPAVAVRRFVANYRHWATVTIHITSPLSGERMKLFFSSLGTTLRGARAARGLDVGLALP
ncbi:MAG: prepilin-type N-terminal cleavage/methylation domain-containing protein [Planctomycetes bacterium]|nr:prepilin-type N-terminal cleavage/methylation domain-containing protein [Planctomycetota bacterium]